MRNVMFFLALAVMASPVMAQNVSKGDIQRLNLDQITLDGTVVTSTGAELNILDGVTSTTAELNILDGVTATAAEINLAADLSTNFEVVAATNILSTAECGKTMTLAHATEFVSTLPAPTAGCKFKFIVGLAPSGASYTVVTTGAETIKGIALDTTGGAGNVTAGADTVTFADGVAAAGDLLDLFSDGTSWHALGFSSSSDAIAFSSAI